MDTMVLSPKSQEAALVEGYVKIPKAAEMLKVKPRMVNHWVKQGIFPGAIKENPFAKTGSRWWIPIEDIDAFLVKRKDPSRFDDGSLDED